MTFFSKITFAGFAALATLGSAGASQAASFPNWGACQAYVAAACQQNATDPGSCMAAGTQACNSLHPVRSAQSEAFRRIVLQRAGDSQYRFRIEWMTSYRTGGPGGSDDSGGTGGGTGGGWGGNDGGNGGGGAGGFAGGSGDLAPPNNGGGGGGGGFSGGSGDLAW